MDHSQLASSYHAGMVAGLALITHNLDQSLSTKEPVNILHLFHHFLVFIVPSNRTVHML